MKVIGSQFAAPARGPRKSEKTSRTAGFKPDAGRSENAGTASRAASAAPAPPVDALLALQGPGDSLDGRGRAQARGHALLDELDDVKLALLEGRAPDRALRSLRRTLVAERDETGDHELEAVLDAIDVRAAVEIAKRERSGR